MRRGGEGRQGAGKGRGDFFACAAKTHHKKKTHPPFLSPPPSPPPPTPDCGETSYRGTGRLANRTALVTGGDSGIGRAVAIAFAREGADVAIAYWKDEEAADAKEVEQLVRDAGRKAHVLQADLASEAGVDAVVESTMGAFGRIDIAVLNASIQTVAEAN